MRRPLQELQKANHHLDGIDLEGLPFSQAAFKSIDAIREQAQSINVDLANGTRIDTHTHAVPDFYLDLVPNTGGAPTPEWNLDTHIQFMINHSIQHSVLSISTPGSNIFPGNATATAAFARLLNEWMAQIAHALPAQFSFFGVTPLPYVSAARREADYVLNGLRGVGLGLLSNHEGFYLGNPQFTRFFSHLDTLKSEPTVMIAHPNDPMIRIANGSLENGDPSMVLVLT